MVVVVVCGHQALGRGCAGSVGTPVSTSCSRNTATAATTPNHPTASSISLLRIFITYRGRLALVVTGMLLQDVQGFDSELALQLTLGLARALSASSPPETLLPYGEKE